MALGDITFLATQVAPGGRGSRLFNVAAGTPILAGEPVIGLATTKAPGLPVVTVGPFPSVQTNPTTSSAYVVGIAATNSTNTTTVSGSVYVNPVNSEDTWIISPAVAATFGVGTTLTQSTYDALVGSRVLIQSGAGNLAYVANTNAGTYSLLATDSANNGAVVAAIDISRYPGKVAFRFRDSVNFLA